MQISTLEVAARIDKQPPHTPLFLGTSLMIDLLEFPELGWISTYLMQLNALTQKRDRVTGAINALLAEGDTYRDCWIETYSKTKNGKQYEYHQLRWLTGERKPSGQPKVQTKHLSRRAVGKVRGAIARGQQVEVLEQQRQQVEQQISKLKRLAQAPGRRLKRNGGSNHEF
ncbi:hypothetical protein ACQ4M4_28300 [Leptolyngbya sp. AN02str]|uniref:hypothetical protein n=1 Tax=Leptolyngbya sp. AN02str TaxID=3423363 RepID=UPI003D31F605